MASSYYRRTSGHERDTILRQGTKADLTSGQIYGRTSGLSILARKADRLRKTDTTVADNDNDDREMIKEDRCESLLLLSFHRSTRGLSFFFRTRDLYIIAWYVCIISRLFS